MSITINVPPGVTTCTFGEQERLDRLKKRRPSSCGRKGAGRLRAMCVMLCISCQDRSASGETHQVSSERASVIKFQTLVDGEPILGSDFGDIFHFSMILDMWASLLLTTLGCVPSFALSRLKRRILIKSEASSSGSARRQQTRLCACTNFQLVSLRNLFCFLSLAVM